MSAAHVDSLIDGYALGALAPAEARAAGGHIDTCARCRRLTREVRATLSLLPASLPALAPRPAVKHCLLAAVKSGSFEASEYRPASMLPFRMDLRASNPLLRWASLGVALAFIIGLVGGVAGWALVLGDRLQQRDDDLAGSRDTIETLLNSEHQIRLESAPRSAGVSALLALPDSGRPLLLLSEAPRLPSGEGYHVWLWAGATPVSIAVLRPDERGDAAARLDADLAGYERIEIDAQALDATVPGGDVVALGALR